jgi:hypothetical protein
VSTEFTANLKHARFHARDLHLVLGPGPDDKPVRVSVTIDGAAPGNRAAEWMSMPLARAWFPSSGSIS